MRKRLGARDVVGRCPGLRGDGEDALGRHEQESGLGINEAADQPGTGDAVYFGPLAGHPPVGPRGELATTGQPELGPTRDAMFEETSVGPGCAERRCSILADFPPVSTIDDDGTPLGQLAAPIINLCGKPTDRTDDYRVVSLESRAPDIDDDRRQLCTEPGIESLRRNRKTVLSVHDRALLASEQRRTWTEDRLTGRLPCPATRQTIRVSG